MADYDFSSFSDEPEETPVTQGQDEINTTQGYDFSSFSDEPSSIPEAPQYDFSSFSDEAPQYGVADPNVAYDSTVIPDYEDLSTHSPWLKAAEEIYISNHNGSVN